MNDVLLPQTPAKPMDQFFSAVSKAGAGADSLPGYLQYIFGGTAVEGKAMLDIGAGNGIFSCYAAFRGAKSVVALEPEAAGSQTSVASTFDRIRSTLDLEQIELARATFQDFDAGMRRFDILLLHNSVNHLDENACMELPNNAAALNIYRSLFQKLSQAAAPGATVIVTDCSPYNFFHLFHLRNPFAPRIEWEKHRHPRLWAELLAETGFRDPCILWTPPGRLLRRRTLLPLLESEPVAFFFTSHFRLAMLKPDESELR